MDFGFFWSPPFSPVYLFLFPILRFQQFFRSHFYVIWHTTTGNPDIFNYRRCKSLLLRIYIQCTTLTAKSESFRYVFYNANDDIPISSNYVQISTFSLNTYCRQPDFFQGFSLWDREKFWSLMIFMNDIGKMKKISSLISDVKNRGSQKVMPNIGQIFKKIPIQSNYPREHSWFENSDVQFSAGKS